MPTAPRSRSANSRCASVACVPGAMAARAAPHERGRVRHRPYHGAAGHRRFERGDRDPRRDRHERARRRRAPAGPPRARRRRRPVSPRRPRRRHRPTAHAALGTHRTFGNCASIACRRSASSSATHRSSGSKPASSRPPSNAAPIRPPPSNAQRVMRLRPPVLHRNCSTARRQLPAPADLRLAASSSARDRHDGEATRSGTTATRARGTIGPPRTSPNGAGLLHLGPVCGAVAGGRVRQRSTTPRRPTSKQPGRMCDNFRCQSGRAGTSCRAPAGTTARPARRGDPMMRSSSASSRCSSSVRPTRYTSPSGPIEKCAAYAAVVLAQQVPVEVLVVARAGRAGSTPRSATCAGGSRSRSSPRRDPRNRSARTNAGSTASYSTVCTHGSSATSPSRCAAIKVALRRDELPGRARARSSRVRTRAYEQRTGSRATTSP